MADIYDVLVIGAGLAGQAFSHVGLVNAAWAIAQAQQRAAPAAPVGLEHRS